MALEGIFLYPYKNPALLFTNHTRLSVKLIAKKSISGRESRPGGRP
jgi:hypothetical protein